MSAPMMLLMRKKSVSLLLFKCFSGTCARSRHSYSKRCFATTHPFSKSVDIEKTFLLPQVQSILKKITGSDLDRMFPEKKGETEAPTYKLLTDEQLQEIMEQAKSRGETKLLMPPVMAPWTNEEKVISNDEDIDSFDTHKYVFTDITYGLHDRERTIAIREPNGVLRLALPAEHDRIIQNYYPRPGYMYYMPKMFEPEYLTSILAEHRYIYVLDRACVQFEPDDPEYIRVTEATYDHIDASRQYDLLRSTRYFGILAFHLAVHERIDGLILDMLNRSLHSDAVDTVILFSIIHPESKTAFALKEVAVSETDEVLKRFVVNDSKMQGELELALQTAQPQTFDTNNEHVNA